MCTALVFNPHDHYFGRNLDLEVDLGQQVVVTPRNFILPFKKAAGLLLMIALTGTSAQAATAVVDPALATTVMPASKHKLKWRYPFARLYRTGVHPWWGQEYGITGYKRCSHPKSYFHDGWDFGHSQVGYSRVNAVHQGTVYRVAYGNGLGWFVWVVSKDNYVEIYQEGFKHKKDIRVKPGQHVRLGQKIGRLTGTHLHLGVTKTSKKYINKHGYPCGNWYKNNGTWLNPIQVIQKGM